MDYEERDVKTWVRADRGGVVYVVIPGRTGWVSSGKTSKKKAIEWALNQSRGGFNSDVTLKEFTEDFYIPGNCKFLKSHEKSGKYVSEKYTTYNRSIVTKYLWPKWGKYTLSAITPSAVDDWLGDVINLRVDGRKGLSLSKATKKRILVVFNQVMNWAVFQGLVTSNRLESIPKISQNSEKRKAFSRFEIKHIFQDPINTFGSTIWALYFMIAADTGMRPQEVSALHWEDWRPKEEAFLVSRAIDHKSNLKGLKTEHKGVTKRAVFLSQKTIQVLIQVQGTNQRTGLIFARPDGRPFRVDTAGNRFSDCLDKLETSSESVDFKRDGRTLYCLRHAFNTNSRTLHGDKVTRALMGHTTESMTNNYDDPEEEDLFTRAKGQGRLG